MKKTSNYHHGNLKEELLAQSLKIIQEEGVDFVTLQVLATKLGTSRSAIYRHFSSKQDLIQNVIFYGFQKDTAIAKRWVIKTPRYWQVQINHPITIFQNSNGQI